jgi:release factor glutamine methyltransferase
LKSIKTMTKSETESWTVGRLLTWTADFLKRHGAVSARLEAEMLLAHSRGCQRIELYTSFHEEVDEATRGGFRELVRRRAAGEPVAYLVGHREFFSLDFGVSPAVLIPRPETEHLVVRALELLAHYEPPSGAPARVVDVGTGSGAIAISVAKHAPTAEITAVDVSEPALEIARQNIARHEVSQRVAVVNCDLLTAFPALPQIDFVLSNPPYVSESEFARLADEVRRHEPRQALVAGPTGTEVIARLIDQAAERLVDGGYLLIEISPMIAAAVRSMFEQSADFNRLEMLRDLAGHARVVVARRIPRTG